MFLKRYFNSRNSIGRLDYFLHWCLLLLVYVFFVNLFFEFLPGNSFNFYFGGITDDLPFILFISFVLIFYFIFSLFLCKLSKRRLLDIDRKNYFWLLFFIPIINLIYAIILCFLTKNPKRESLLLKEEYKSSRSLLTFFIFLLVIIFVILRIASSYYSKENIKLQEKIIWNITKGKKAPHLPFQH